MKDRILLFLIIVLVFTACTAVVPIEVTREVTRIIEQTVIVTPASPTATHTPADKLWIYTDMTVGFIQTGSEGGWRAANTASFKETAEELGITLKVYDSSQRVAVQHTGFLQLIEDDKVDVIVLAALEADSWDDLLSKAQAAGKVVILQERRIDVPEDLYATYVGSDFVQEGRLAAEQMCRLLANSDKKNILEMVGNIGSSAAKDRAQGFREKMGECGIEIINGMSMGFWADSDAKAALKIWLQEAEVQGVFAQNDAIALSAIEAIKEVGLKPGVDIKIVSVDATAAAFEAMLAGELNASVECNPLLAPQVYEAALRALNGEDLPKWIPTEESVFYAGMPDLAQIAEGRRY